MKSGAAKSGGGQAVGRRAADERTASGFFLSPSSRDPSRWSRDSESERLGWKRDVTSTRNHFGGRGVSFRVNWNAH